MAYKSTRLSDTIRSMNEQQMHNLEAWTTWFAEPVAKLRDELQKQPEPSVWMREYLRSEFSITGLCLAQLRERIEAVTGINNPARLEAHARYDSAMNDRLEAYDMPDDGSGLICNQSDWLSAAPESCAYRIEKAQRAVVDALIAYSAP
jgi:hypothetical protein